MTATSPTMTTTDAAFNRNIPRLFIFKALMSASLWMPIWVVFLHDERQLSLSEVYFIAGLGWVIQALAEVPSGILSDIYGRRFTLLSGGLVLALGLFLLATLTGFSGVLLAYLFWAIGNALISGSDTALLYDSAVAAGREAEFADMASTMFQVLLAAQALGSIVGGLLGAVDLRLPILATVVLTLAAVVVLLQIAEPPTHTPDAASATARRSWLATLGTALSEVRRRPLLAALLAYGAILPGTAFFIPFVLFQPQMQAQGVPVGWLGILFTALRLAALLGSRFGPRIVSAGSHRQWLLAVPLVMAIGCLGVAASPVWWLTIAVMGAVTATDAAIRPETTTRLNQQISSTVRATILSLQNLVMTLYVAALHPAAGAVADATTTAGAFVLLGLLCLIPLLLALPLRSHVVRPVHTYSA